MFAVTPFAAMRQIFTMNDAGGMDATWKPCRVIGIDASGDEPTYLVEVRDSDGSFYIAKEDTIRKCPPTA